MSHTEIYGFKDNGDATLIGEATNSFRGAMAVWIEMEKKYLGPLPNPGWIPEGEYKARGYWRSASSFGVLDNPKGNPMREVWALFSDDTVDAADKIVLGTTFDNVVVRRKFVEEVIECFENFRGETNLKEQAEVLREALKDPDIIAVAWNQTSVNGDNWENRVYDEDGNSSPYNFITGKEHWFLFQDENDIVAEESIN